MNEVEIFQNEKFGNIRIVERNGEIWFVGKDVAEALGYEKTRNAINEHVEKDDALKQGVTDSMGRIQKTTLINESGLYSLILGSKLESAKEFKHWVTSEILPSIRKTGGYTAKTVHQDSPLEKAKFLHEIAAEYADSPVYKQILDAYAVKEVTGSFVLPLPDAVHEEFSATEIGEMLGITANMVGKIANRLGIKTEAYGRWVIDKSPYSSKEVRSFRYYRNAIEKIKSAV